MMHILLGWVFHTHRVNDTVNDQSNIIFEPHNLFGPWILFNIKMYLYLHMPIL